MEGAAASYGKAGRAGSGPELLDDLFKTCPAGSSGSGSLGLADDFDPRAEGPPAQPEAASGLFSQAFGSPSTSDAFADFGSAFPHARAPAGSPAAPPAASNLDLLSELSPPPMASAPPGFNDMDALAGQFSAATLQPISQDVRQTVPYLRGQLASAQEHLDTGLRAIDRIKSKAEATTVKILLTHVVNFLPGPTTVHKLCSQEVVMDEAMIDMHSKMLGILVKLCLPHWPLLKHEIMQAFTVEDSFELSHECLTALCGFLKEESDFVMLEALADILINYSKSDSVLTAIIRCSVVGKNDREELKVDWQNYVQLLATLPERVANRLTTKTPKQLSHGRFAYVLAFQIIRALDYVAESNYHSGIKYDLDIISYLVSKFVNVYNGTEAMSKFIDFIVAWSIGDATDTTRFIKVKLVQTLLKKLNRQAIDNVALGILKRCPIDYRGGEQPITMVLGDSFDASKDWRDVLSFRVPFCVKPTRYKDTAVVENLIYYISMSKNSQTVLSDLVLRLATAWANVKATYLSSVDDLMYTSQLLVLSVKYRTSLAVTKRVTWHSGELKKVLFKGFSKHLDLLSKEHRAVGMATIELILKTLAAIDTADAKAANQLAFDYKEMGHTCVEIHDILKDLTQRCLIEKTRKVPVCNTNYGKTNLAQTLDSIAFEIIDNDIRPVHNTIVTCAVKSQEQTKSIVKTIISAKLDALDKCGAADETLDSDDDLQPYDMTNDVTSSSKTRPMYLRDLLEVIAEAKDLESFESAVMCAEELVNKQLRYDRNFAVELLDLFTHLEEKYYIENFDSIKFNTCVAIVCSQPAICAEHLCREIHTDVGRYSIATKIFMLDVLSESANRLADIYNVCDVKQKPDILLRPDEEPGAEEIIRRRLINKTRYFHSRRPHPFSRAKRNRFASVADYFIYHLIGGFGRKQLTLSRHNLKQDVDNTLLLKYLSVVGNMILAAKNCPKCANYCREALPMVLYLRYSSEPRVQASIISIVASISLVLPESLMRGEFFGPLMEIRQWLIDCLTNLDLTMKFGGPKSEMALFAGQVLHLIEKTLVDVN